MREEEVGEELEKRIQRVEVRNSGDGLVGQMERWMEEMEWKIEEDFERVMRKLEELEGLVVEEYKLGEEKWEEEKGDEDEEMEVVKEAEVGVGEVETEEAGDVEMAG